MIQIHIFFFSPPPFYIYLEGRSIFVVIHHACLTNRGRSLRGDSALPATSAYSNGATLNQCRAFFFAFLCLRSTGPLVSRRLAHLMPVHPDPPTLIRFLRGRGSGVKATKNSELSFQRVSKFLLALESGQEIAQEAQMLSFAVQQKFLFSFSHFPFCWRRHKQR